MLSNFRRIEWEVHAYERDPYGFCFDLLYMLSTKKMNAQSCGHFMLLVGLNPSLISLFLGVWGLNNDSTYHHLYVMRDNLETKECIQYGLFRDIPTRNTGSPCWNLLLFQCTYKAGSQGRCVSDRECFIFDFCCNQTIHTLTKLGSVDEKPLCPLLPHSPNPSHPTTAKPKATSEMDK